MKARSLVAARRVGSEQPLNWPTKSTAISNGGKTGEQVFTILAKRTEVTLGNQRGIGKKRKNLFSSIEKGSYRGKFTVASIA